MQKSENIVKTSFFDENQTDDESSVEYKIANSFWMKPSQFKDLQKQFMRFSEKILIEGYLLKKSQKKDVCKNRYFVLYEDRLVRYLDANKKQEKGVLILKGVKLELFDPVSEEEIKNSQGHIQEKFCFFLSHNKKFDLLFATNKEEFDKWLNVYKQTCILTYFGKYFSNMRVIGKGTFAKVILSRRLTDNKEYAVKTFDKKNLLQSKSANRSKVGLINEIFIMRNLNHPNIIKLYEVYEGQYHIYLVLELLKGGELFDRIIKKGHYSEKDAATIISKLLSALEFMHNRGIMHRDIKPENLILKDENEYDIKLADFGLAEYQDKKDLLFKRCGTPGYVAPEILDDKPYDTKVDIFSAGAILYILLTGCSPFYGKTCNEILLKNKDCIVNFDFEQINISLSNEAIDLLKKMLMKNPKERISAKECLQHTWIVSNVENASGLTENVDASNKHQVLNSAQENMKKFQEERFNVKNIKPKEIIMNSPLITGRTDAIKQSDIGNSPTMSPAYVPGGQNSSSNDMHKRAIMKNLREHGFGGILGGQKKKPSDEDVTEEGSPFQDNMREMKERGSVFNPAKDKGSPSILATGGANTNYTQSPLGKKSVKNISPMDVLQQKQKNTVETEINKDKKPAQPNTQNVRAALKKMDI